VPEPWCPLVLEPCCPLLPVVECCQDLPPQPRCPPDARALMPIGARALLPIAACGPVLSGFASVAQMPAWCPSPGEKGWVVSTLEMGTVRTASTPSSPAGKAAQFYGNEKLGGPV